jgi:hypothetical protein
VLTIYLDKEGWNIAVDEMSQLQLAKMSQRPSLGFSLLK